MGKKKKDKELLGYSDMYPVLAPAMTRHEIRAGMGIPEELILDIDHDSGLFLGLKSSNGKGYFVGKASERDGNALTVGINGSGKSYIIAKSTIETWRDPFVALDIKGELAAHYKSLFKKGVVKRPFIIFDPGKFIGQYDAYHQLRADDVHFVQNVREISSAIIPMPPDIREPYWTYMARDALSAAIIFFFKQGLSFIETMIAVLSISIHELCRNINRSGCLMAKMLISEIGGLKPEQKSSIGTELKRHTMVFATDECIQSVLCNDETTGKDSFSWDDVVGPDEPVNVFLCLDQDRLEQWSGVMRLMLTQLVRALERRPDKHSRQGYCYPPVLVLLDEFPLLGKMDIMTSALTTLRSKKVTFCLMIQSLPQLDMAYGSDARKIIVDNCQYKVILNVTEPDSQEYFSRLIGTVPTGRRGISESYDPHTQRLTYGRQLSEIREPLIYPHEFATNLDIWLHTPNGFYSAIKLHVSKTRLHVNDYEKLLQEKMRRRSYHVNDQ